MTSSENRKTKKHLKTAVFLKRSERFERSEQEQLWYPINRRCSNQFELFRATCMIRCKQGGRQVRVRGCVLARRERGPVKSHISHLLSWKPRAVVVCYVLWSNEWFTADDQSTLTASCWPRDKSHFTHLTFTIR